jgi:hypothetical protein
MSLVVAVLLLLLLLLLATTAFHFHMGQMAAMLFA